MKKLIIALAAAACLSVLTGCGKKNVSNGITITDGVLKVGCEVGYPPFEYYDVDGKTPIGFDMELAKEVASRLGMKCEIIDTAWDGILAGLDTDKYDCIMSAMTITPDRSANYAFTRPYIGNGQSIVVLKTSQLAISSPAELTGLQVGYQDETTSDIFMTKQAQEGLKFTPAEYDKVLNAFDDLRLGRIDAVCADALVSVSYLSSPDSPFKMIWQGTPDEYFGICVKKSNTELQQKMDKIVAEMFEDGSLLKISEKIFNADMISTAK